MLRGLSPGTQGRNMREETLRGVRGPGNVGSCLKESEWDRGKEQPKWKM